MRVTVCQLEAHPEPLSATMAMLGDHARSNASDLVLLPEMVFSEWLAADPRPDARRWDESVAAHDRAIASLADLQVDAVAGTRPIVTATGSRRNQAFVWRRGIGEPAAVHEKHYLPDEPRYWERTWYEGGARSFETARVGEAIVGFQICTEMWFFEWSRHLGLSRVDLLCVPRATPRGSTDKWLAGGRAAAVCSGAYCLSSNHWSPPGVGSDAGGRGWVIDPEGDVLVTTDEQQPFATIEVDLEFSRRSKSTYPRDVPE